MTMKKNTANPVPPQQDPTEAKQPIQDDPWENCKGQCGFTSWCRECILVKDKLLVETLNRQGRSDDKEE